MGTFTPRFYIVLQPNGPASNPFLKVPTGNVITSNSFLSATAGKFNVINNTEKNTYRCENIVTSNVSLAAAAGPGSTQGMVSGAMHFSNEGCRRVGYGSVAPLAGTWDVGDVVVNTAPVAGGQCAWVCVAAGSPGTWNRFATIVRANDGDGALR